MRIAALALICIALSACATPKADQSAQLCAVLDATATAYSRPDTPGLSAAQDRRLNAISQDALNDDVTCGATIYRHDALGLSIVGVGFERGGAYAAVQTHTSDGQYFVSGSRCLLRRRGHSWQVLGCRMLYIS